MMSDAPIQIECLADGARMRDWLAIPRITMGDDPVWVQPLDIAERERVSRRHNVFFEFGEAEFFIAYSNGKPVGRISAQDNQRHLQHHGDHTGQFGFFDCVNDPVVAAALVNAAGEWLARRGRRRMQGPFSLTINQESGLLVSGFDQRPAIMTGHGTRYAPALLEGCGLSKVVDLYSYQMSTARVPERAARLGRLATETGRVRVRNIDLKKYDAEASLIFDIFNDAWTDNWGFVPFSPNEAIKTARELRPFMRSKFGFIVEIDGEPAAMAVVLPDLNEVIAPFKGRLLPFNWTKLAYAVLRDDWRSARIVLLGIRKKYRNTPLAAGVLSLLVAEFIKLSQQYKEIALEMSWVAETNRPMVALAEMNAGQPNKVYRIYGKDIGDGVGVVAKFEQ